MPKYGYKLVLVENYVEKHNSDIDYRPIGAIIKIKIPDDAIIKIVQSSGYVEKRRCSKCKFVSVEGYYNLVKNSEYSDDIVLTRSLDKESRIYTKDLYKMMKSKRNIAPNKKEPIKFVSLYDNSFEYIKGKDIYPDHFQEYDFDNDGCTNGIHYFNMEWEVKKFFEIMLKDFLMRCMIYIDI